MENVKRAMNWLEENRHLLRGECYGPVAMHVKVFRCLYIGLMISLSCLYYIIFFVINVIIVIVVVVLIVVIVAIINVIVVIGGDNDLQR